MRLIMGQMGLEKPELSALELEKRMLYLTFYTLASTNIN